MPIGATNGVTMVTGVCAISPGETNGVTIFFAMLQCAINGVIWVCAIMLGTSNGVARICAILLGANGMDRV